MAARQLEPGQPIELTCPLKLVDELDVELTSVEWRYQFQEPADDDSMRLATKLIWRSNDNQNQSSGGNTNATHVGQQHGRRDLDKQRMTIMMKLDSGDQQASGSDSLVGEAPGGGRIGLEWNSGSSQARNWPMASTSADKLAIIDYVTRANATGRSDGRRQSDHSSNDAAPSDDGNDDNNNNNNNKTLIRLVHLILEPDEAKLARGKRHQIWFLCQVSNLAGQMSLWQPIEFGPLAGGELQSSEQLRFPLASNLGRVSSELSSLIERQVAALDITSSGPPPGNSNSSGTRLERVKSALEPEFAQLEISNSSSDDHSNQVLFVPISVTPRRLLANIFQNDRQLGRMDSLERSLISANLDQVRLTKSRQASPSSQKNSTRDGDSSNRWQDSAARNFGREFGSSRPEQTGQGEDAADETLQSSDLLPLQRLAVDAIGRFTGGRLHLPEESRSRLNQQGGMPAGVEGSADVEEELGEQLARAWRARDQRLRELYRIFSARVAEWARSSRHFAAVLPHLVAGLIVGCLLTLIILFKVNSCAPHDDDKHEPDTDSGRRRLPTVKLRRKIASECSSGGRESEEARSKSNPGGARRQGSEQAGHQLGAKPVELGLDEELVGDEISDQFDDGPDRRHERQQAARRARFEVEEEKDEGDNEDEDEDEDDDDDEELCSRYQLELSPLPPPPPPLPSSSSSGLELDVRELLQRAQRACDGSPEQPTAAAAAGSTGSATTTTSGSQRMLLPPRSCALGVGQRRRTEFCATPSKSSGIGGGGHVRQKSLNSCLTGSLTRTIQKSSTLQNFSSTGANNYERLMSAADATSQLVVEPTTEAASTWKGANLIGAGKSSTLQRPASNRVARSSATMTSAARLAGQRRWRPTGGKVESNNRRTVTWLMSNESIRNDCVDYARAGGAVRPVPDELEVTTLSGVLPCWGGPSGGPSGCRRIDDNNNNNNNNSCSSNDLTSCTAELIGVGPQLEAHVSALRGTPTTANLCWTPSEVHNQRQPPVVGYGRDPRGSGQVDFLDPGSGFNVLPACLCVDGQTLVLDADGGQRQVARGGECDHISDSDESYYLYRPIGPL